MSIIDSLAKINPALIILAIAFVYGLFYVVRKNVSSTLLLLWGLIILTLFIFPGGQSALKEARALPDILNKFGCLGTSLVDGRVLGNNKIEPNACIYNGTGLQPNTGTSSSAPSTIKAAGESLKSLGL